MKRKKSAMSRRPRRSRVKEWSGYRTNWSRWDSSGNGSTWINTSTDRCGRTHWRALANAEGQHMTKTNNTGSKPQAAAAQKTERGYSDLHDHLKTLDKAGLLITVDREINKDTEMHPLVRWQFRGGIAERDRKAF